MSSLTRKIGDVAKVKGGKRLPKGMSVLDEATEYPYLRVVDFSDGGIDRSGIKYIDSKTFDYIKRYTIDSSDVYISIAGTIGRVGVVPDDLSGASLTENAARITEISDDVNNRYLMYYLRSPVGRGAFKNRTGGTSQPKLALHKIADIDFPCRPLPTQRHIVSTLSTYDDLININRRRIQFLEEAARFLYREWFVYFRFPENEKTKKVGGVPEGWRKGSLEDITTIKKGRNITFEQAIEGNIPVVGGGLEPTYYHNKANVCAPVITVSASGANAGYVNLYHSDVWASDCSYMNRETTKHIFYLFLMLKSLQAYMTGLQVGVAQPHVYPKDLNRSKVLIPSDEICERFELLVTPMFDLIKNLKHHNQKLAQARDFLLPRLMTGKIDVSEIDIEVAQEAEA